MIKLDIKATFTIQGDGEPESEAKKLESALREFLKFYKADSGEVCGYQVEVVGNEI